MRQNNDIEGDANDDLFVFAVVARAGAASAI